MQFTLRCGLGPVSPGRVKEKSQAVAWLEVGVSKRDKDETASAHMHLSIQSITPSSASSLHHQLALPNLRRTYLHTLTER